MAHGSHVILTLFHHAYVHTAFEPACLAVAPVVFGDGATPVKRTCEAGFALHTASKCIIHMNSRLEWMYIIMYIYV